MWAGAATATYNAGVAYVGRANEKVEPGYATAPASPLVSGSAESLLPFADLGQQGRRYVTDVVTPELIEQVMGEPAVAHPIRTYVGFNSEPLYQTGRAELALAELDRTGAFDRSYLLLVSPTGTGWVDHDADRGGRVPHPRRHRHLLHPVRPVPVVPVGAEGRAGPRQFRLLLWGVKQRLDGVPPEQAPQGAGLRREPGRLDQLGRASCTRASRASTTTASTGRCGWGCRGWPSGRAAA